MSQPQRYKPYGALQVKKSVAYTSDDLPTGVTIDTLQIVEAPLVWRKALNQDGTLIKERGKPKYVKGNKRGVYILIVNSNATYDEDFPNVPSLYLEGDEIVMDTDNTYTFLENCTVEYGEKTT